MKSATFDYHRARSADEVIDILAGNEDAKALAGGQSLVPLLSMRLARPTTLVDINHLDDLDYVRRENSHLEIGAVTRQRTVETSTVVRRDVPLLAHALRHVGHVTIRNRGTIGGSIAHADPAAELPAALCALDGEILVRGPGGERRIPAREFFVSYLMTDLAPDEIITGVTVPVLPDRTACAVEELARRSGDFALVAVFAAVTFDDSGTCSDARIAIGGAAPVPVRADAAESVLRGAVIDPGTIAAAAEQVAAATTPSNDIHAPAEYRREMAAVLTRRAIQRAVDQTFGGTS